MNKTIIMGVSVDNRNDCAIEVQKLLTEYGCYIKTRLGLHEAEMECSPKGIVLLIFASHAAKEADELEAKLKALTCVSVNKMTI